MPDRAADGMPVLRAMTRADLAQIEKIECASFPDPWTGAGLEAELTANSRTEAVVLEEQGRICGYLFAIYLPGEASLNNIAVAPQDRRRGLGRRLLEHFLLRVRAHGCEEAYLEVAVHNAAALSLYRSVGFQQIGIRKNYYASVHEDAYTLVWTSETGGEEHVSSGH